MARPWSFENIGYRPKCGWYIYFIFFEKFIHVLCTVLFTSSGLHSHHSLRDWFYRCVLLSYWLAPWDISVLITFRMTDWRSCYKRSLRTRQLMITMKIYRAVSGFCRWSSPWYSLLWINTDFTIHCMIWYDGCFDDYIHTVLNTDPI